MRLPTLRCLPPLTDFATPPRLGRYEKDGTLSFIPPDGRFRLMDYVIPSPTAAAATSAGVSGSSALSSNRVGGIDEQSGVRFKTRIKLHESGGPSFRASSLITLLILKTFQTSVN